MNRAAWYSFGTPPMIDWSGIFHILATPFRDDGGLDIAELGEILAAVTSG